METQLRLVAVIGLPPSLPGVKATVSLPAPGVVLVTVGFPGAVTVTRSIVSLTGAASMPALFRYCTSTVLVPAPAGRVAALLVVYGSQASLSSVPSVEMRIWETPVWVSLADKDSVTFVDVVVAAPPLIDTVPVAAVVSRYTV